MYPLFASIILVTFQSAADISNNRIANCDLPGWMLPPTRRPLKHLELHRCIVKCCLISQNYTWSKHFLYLKSNNSKKSSTCNIFHSKALYFKPGVFSAFEEWN